MIFGLLAPVTWAVRQFGWGDRLITLLVLVGISLPSFLIGLLMIMLFAVSLRWFPASGMFAIYGGGGAGDLLHHLVLPTVTLAVVATGVIARLTRTAMLEVLRQDYIHTARAKGVSERRVIWRHAFRVALVSVIPAIGIQAGFVLGGAVLYRNRVSVAGAGSDAGESRLNPRSAAGAGRRAGGRHCICVDQSADRYRAGLSRPEGKIMTETTLIPPRRTGWALLLHNRLAAFGLLLLAVTLLSALIAPLLPLPDPDATDLLQRLAPPLTPGHLLGTDALGRDMLSRLLWGTRVSVAVGLCATLLAAVCGTLIGLIAGYTAGRTDTILMRLIDMIMAFPYILLALAIVAVLGPGLLNALYAIALVNIPFFARNVRGLTLGLRGRRLY